METYRPNRVAVDPDMSPCRGERYSVARWVELADGVLVRRYDELDLSVSTERSLEISRMRTSCGICTTHYRSRRILEQVLTPGEHLRGLASWVATGS